MLCAQPGILAPIPPLARYLTFLAKPDSDPAIALKRLPQIVDGARTVVGLGESLTLELGRRIPGMRTFRGRVASGVEAPSSPAALWCWLRGDDRGELVHRARRVREALAKSFTLESTVDAFRYGASLDLTGYEDGTENPTGEQSVEAAITCSAVPGLNGSSFAAVQRWIHDLDHFESMSELERDHVIGRRRINNEEIDDAPVSAHVKRTAQESFEPEAFVVRRSMPWADADHEGLMFVAFGKSLDAFEALLERMMGAEDGVTDALFRFTRPVTGSYYWCPPISRGRLNCPPSALTDQRVTVAASVRPGDAPVRRAIAASALILAAAGLVRFVAALGDFWFDEIWSWSITLNLSSPLAVLTRIQHENNHPLNTWVIWLVGGDAHWIWYRFPAVLAGVGSVALAGRIAGSRLDVDRLTAMLLVGGSYLCIHFSSEARGYSYVIFFSLLAFVLQRAALKRPRAFVDGLLAGTLVLGVLSHLTFLYCWASIIVWAGLRTARNGGPWAPLIRAHVPPMLFSVWFYLVNVRAMTQGGGEIPPPAEVIASTLSLALGGPASGPGAWLFAATTVAVLLAGLLRTARSGSDLWVFYACVTLVAPAGLMFFAGRELYVRYFVIAVVFFLILGSQLAGDLWRRDRSGRVACVVFLALFLVANGLHTARLVRLGRGQYEQALQRIRDESRTIPGSIGSDHDFRNSLVFLYYRQRLASPRELYFHTLDGWPQGGPEWFIRHSLALRYDPEPRYSDPWGNDYQLAHVYPYAGLSGWNWAVYRNVRDLGAATSR